MNIRVKAGMSDLERELEYGFRDYETTKTFDLPWKDDTKARRRPQSSASTRSRRPPPSSVPAYTVVDPKTQARTEVPAASHSFYRCQEGCGWDVDSGEEGRVTGGRDSQRHRR